MTSKQQYEETLAQIETVETSLDILGTTLSEVDPESVNGLRMSDMYGHLSAITSWVEAKITALEQEELNQRLTTFLVDLKGIMQTANAKIEIIGGDGYGESYGESGDPGFKISVEENGLTAEKVYSIIVLTGGDI